MSDLYYYGFNDDLVEVASAQARAGEYSDAFVIACEMLEHRWQAAALVFIAQAQIEVGDVSAAAKTVHQIDDPELDAYPGAYFMLAKAQAENGPFDEALATAGEISGECLMDDGEYSADEARTFVQDIIPYSPSSPGIFCLTH